MSPWLKYQIKILGWIGRFWFGKVIFGYVVLRASLSSHSPIKECVASPSLMGYGDTCDMAVTFPRPAFRHFAKQHPSFPRPAPSHLETECSKASSFHVKDKVIQ
ncbi:hypothetical protein CIPAW_11G096100 [Carya illinoinensis]|uniref:Uncharacterized protein n=1 Tax=Carya illinoinensis TaxID=32201 RepID=A0A8T1P0K0_CARIL|nr:hypothetical protein CIPAW_11G096100 [Carya illinoinensis]